MDKRIENLLAALKDIEECTFEDKEGKRFEWISFHEMGFDNNRGGWFFVFYTRKGYHITWLQGLKIVEDSDEH